MGSQSYILALFAGALSILSPCVLPLLPVVFGTAAGKHRFGPAALGAGLVASFVGFGLFIATIGYSIGLDGQYIRMASGFLLACIGALLVTPALGARVALAAGPASAWLARRFGSAGDPGGVHGQFLVGVLLGAIWSPCVGPTLGAASLLAARGENLGEVAFLMTAFGVGTAVPLALIGAASRETFMRWRGKIIAAGRMGKTLLGTMLLVIGLAVASGIDKSIEAWLVGASPEWLTRLTTSL